MMNTKEWNAILDELIQREEVIIKIAKTIKEQFGTEEKVVTKEKATPAKNTTKVEDAAPVPEADVPKTYTKEEVRALLANKAKEDGYKYKQDVKAVVSMFSTDGTLTNVPTEKYADLVKELEGLGNG